MAARREDLNERMDRFIIEQTGLPSDTIKAVLDAQYRFYFEHRGNLAAIVEFLEEHDDENEEDAE